MKKSLLVTLVSLLALVSQAAPKARIDTITIASQYVDPDMKVIVITPDADDTTTPRPVVYLLHGYSDDYRCWPHKSQPALDSLATNWGMIFVCPDGRDTWYFNAKGNQAKQMESFFVNDLVPAIDSLYPTIADREHRAITGLSMGGHGAWWLALNHKDIWGNVGSTSGGVDINRFPGHWKIHESLGDYDEKTWKAHSIYYLVDDKLQPGELNIIFDCGVDDFFYECNNDLHQKLLDKKIPHDFISRPGAHTHPYWRNAILYQLQYFNERFKEADRK